MAKHASPSAHFQVVESPESVSVQIPLPVLGALVDAKSALFDRCVLRFLPCAREDVGNTGHVRSVRRELSDNRVRFRG